MNSTTPYNRETAALHNCGFCNRDIREVGYTTDEDIMKIAQLLLKMDMFKNNIDMKELANKPASQIFKKE